MSENRKPILCLDFDGVIHSYTSAWKGADVIPDPPVPGVFEFILAASEVFEVHVFSSRSSLPGGIGAMQRWFLEWGDQHPLSVVHFPTSKPPSFVGIDDRVLTFTGTWPTIRELVEFKPWNKRSV